MKIKFRYKNTIDYLCLMLFFIAAFGYMPTARPSDRFVWVAALAILLINSLYNVLIKGFKINIDTGAAWYVSIVMFGALSCIWSTKIIQFEHYMIFNFIVIMCSVFCISVYLQSVENIDNLFYIMMIAGCIAACRYCYYTPWASILTSGYYMRGTFGRLLDDVTNYNNYTSFLCILSIIACYYAIVRKVKWCYFPFLFLTAVVVFGGSRKNLFVIPAVAMFFSLSQGNLKEKLKAVISVILIVVAGFYAIMNFDFLSQIKNATINMLIVLSGGLNISDNSTIERLYLISAANDGWRQHPILGVGWDNFRYYNLLNLYAHNNYFEVLASLGLVGFILYYSYFANWFLKFAFDFLKRQSSKWAILLSGVLISYLIQDYGSITIYSRLEMILLLVVMLCCSVAENKKVYRLTFSHNSQINMIRR